MLLHVLVMLHAQAPETKSLSRTGAGLYDSLGQYIMSKDEYHEEHTSFECFRTVRAKQKC